MHMKEVLLLWFPIFFIKSPQVVVLKMKLNKMNNQLKKISIIRKLKKLQVYLSFKDNIWGSDVADMQLTSKSNKGIRF